MINLLVVEYENGKRGLLEPPLSPFKIGDKILPCRYSTDLGVIKGYYHPPDETQQYLFDQERFQQHLRDERYVRPEVQNGS